MTPQDVITEVRSLIQDLDVPYRYSDAVLLSFVNSTIKRMVMLRPDLFTTVQDISTTPNVSEQLLPSSAVRLVEIFRNKNGASIEEVLKDDFDKAYPQWTTDPAGTPTKYIRHPRNPRAYFLYPKPTSGVVLVGEYVATPSKYTIAQNIDVIPDAYLPALVDGTVYISQSIDNESVNSNKAKFFLESFTNLLGVSLQSRVVTDTESGNVGSDSRGAQQ